MTSNLGARDGERASIGFDNSRNTNASMDAVNKHFTPEFRNRLDSIIEFNRLTKEQIKPIVHKFVDELNELLEPKSIKLDVTESAVLKLIEDGFNDKMGARPMKRIISEKVKMPLSKRIIFNNLTDTVVTLDFNGADYEFK
jgi:ATP-dependent Clp protease ATP-binding subunit ClpA